MATIFKRKTASGKLTKRYYFKFKDADGKWKVKVGTADKEATKRLAAKHESDATLQSSGLAIETDLKGELPIAAYQTHLRAQGDTPTHVTLTVSQLKTIFAACGFATLRDLRQSNAADKVSEFLETKKRESKRKPRIDNPKRKPRVEYEPEQLGPISARTKNAYLTALKGFCKWCVTTGKMPDCRLMYLKRVKATDKPVRRAATDAEISSILEAAIAGGETHGLTGEQRYHLYRVALSTGFRASELASLTPDAFRLKGTLPYILLEGADAKNDNQAEQPIRPELAADLARWLKGKPASASVWPGGWHKEAAAMLRVDLASAGVPYVSKGRTLDFHALRGTFITSLARAGVHPRTAQILARHSDINLTMKAYTLLGLDEVAAVLPPVCHAVGPSRQTVAAAGRSTTRKRA